MNINELMNLAIWVEKRNAEDEIYEFNEWDQKLHDYERQCNEDLADDKNDWEG